jgi:hypothetical protein
MPLDEVMLHGKLDANLFALDKINIDALDDLVKTTLDQTKMKNNRVAHLVLRRALPGAKDVRWRIYVEAVGGIRGDLEADTKGTVINVIRN